jgi:hypothetical protein
MATIAIPTETCKTLIADLYGTADQAGAVQPTPRPEPLPEAAFSLTLKGTIGGIEAMLTIRGGTAAVFQANVLAVRGLLDTPSQTALQAPPTAPALPAAPAATQDGWCAVHSVAMSKQSNQRGSWWSHKAQDGSWCKGR